MEHIKRYLSHLSLPLATIDVQNLSLIQFPGNNGADTDRTANLGLYSTPAGKAVGTDKFNMVSYLVDQVAQIHRTLAHSGSTVSQLASINGHFDNILEQTSRKSLLSSS